MQLFEASERSEVKQGSHSFDSMKLLELDLKNCLGGLARHLFGSDVETRWANGRGYSLYLNKVFC